MQQFKIRFFGDGTFQNVNMKNIKEFKFTKALMKRKVGSKVFNRMQALKEAIEEANKALKGSEEKDSSSRLRTRSDRSKSAPRTKKEVAPAMPNVSLEAKIVPEETFLDWKDTKPQSCASPIAIDKKEVSKPKESVVEKWLKRENIAPENGKEEWWEDKNDVVERARYSKRERRAPIRFDEIDKNEDEEKKS